jgi:protein tyrosine/serine phosphatase
VTDLDVSTSSTAGRRVAFASGAFNVRDLGGLRTELGGRLRPGLVYRADGLHRLPAEEVRRLAELGVRTVVDLRTAGELEVAASVKGDGIVVLHLPVLREVWPHDAFSDEETADPVAFLIARYLEMLDEGPAAISSVFELLSTPACRPLAFHCSAGKDRTGVVAALVLGALGVPDDVIAADYAASAEAMEKLVAWVRERRPEAADSMNAQPKAILSCPADAMHGFLDAVRERYGSVEGYLARIGVTEATMSAVHTALVDP